MKNSKKGISLIVLVITIIVIIILAAAVLLSMNSNNPIGNATTARNSNDISEVQSAVTLYLANYMAQNNGSAPTITFTSNTFTFSTTSEPTINVLGLPSTITSVKIDNNYKVLEIMSGGTLMTAE